MSMFWRVFECYNILNINNVTLQIHAVKMNSAAF